jgi:hypothetical protein
MAVNLFLRGLKMSEIKFPAIGVAHTPSGPKNCCKKHAVQIVALCNCMGVHIDFEPIFDDRECTNCQNEAKMKKGKRTQSLHLRN